jgi:hypothetical protein
MPACPGQGAKRYYGLKYFQVETWLNVMTYVCCVYPGQPVPCGPGTGDRHRHAGGGPGCLPLPAA